MLPPAKSRGEGERQQGHFAGFALRNLACVRNSSNSCGENRLPGLADGSGRPSRICVAQCSRSTVTMMYWLYRQTPQTNASPIPIVVSPRNSCDRANWLGLTAMPPILPAHEKAPPVFRQGNNFHVCEPA